MTRSGQRKFQTTGVILKLGANLWGYVCNFFRITNQLSMKLGFSSEPLSNTQEQQE